MAEIRKQIRSSATRRKLELGMRRRDDIVQLAGAFIAWQDDRQQGRSRDLPEVPSGLVSAECLADHLINHSEYGSADCPGLAVAGGTRHPLLQWSPVLQIEREKAADGRVGGKLINELPFNVATLTAYFEISMGLRPPNGGSGILVVSATPGGSASQSAGADSDDDAAENEEARMDAVRAAFEVRFGISILDIAKRLLSIRACDPVLYVLLLSREYRLALRYAPVLADEANRGGSSQHDKVPLIIVFASIGEVQRMVTLLRDLTEKGPITARDIDAAVGKRAVSKRQRGLKMAVDIGKDTAPGRVYDRAPMQAEGLRKRFFMLLQRKLSSLEARSFLRSLYEGSDLWDNAASAQSRHGSHELLANIVAPKVQQKRVKGRGFAIHKESRLLYYGIPSTYLPHLALVELGMVFTGHTGRGSTVILADRILEVVASIKLSEDGQDPQDSAAHETLHKKAVRALHSYLPRFPGRGSAGRFNAALWLNPGRDRVLFRQLLQPIAAGDYRMGWHGRRGKFYQAMFLLQSSFPALYASILERPIAIRIVCDLATSSTVLTSDPIFLNLLRRAEEANSSTNRKSKSRNKRSNFQNAAKLPTTENGILREIKRVLRR